MAKHCDENAMGPTPRWVKAVFAAVNSLIAVVPFAALLAAALIVQSSPTVAAKPIKIVAFGDSLTAGYRLPPDAAFPVQLKRR